MTDPYGTEFTVQMGNGTTAQILKVVSLVLHSYIPGLTTSLLSVRRLQEKGVEVIVKTGAVGEGSVEVVDKPSN